MVGKKFGLKEAVAASQYTQTEGERRSVLGVLGVLGVKNTVLKEANTRCTKIVKEIGVNDDKLLKLREKMNTIEDVNDDRANEEEEINDTVKDWVL